MHYYIDKLVQDDCASAFDIHCDSHIVPWSSGAFNDCLTPPYFASQLIFNEKVSGYYVGLQVLDEITLMDVAVHHQHRGQGMGKILIDDFIVTSRAKQAQTIWLEVRESNSPALHLYKENGFKVIETRKGYYPSKNGRENGIVMNLKLTP